MSTPANVHSLEAIDALRMALVSFIEQVSDALSELDAEMRRMLNWLEHDRPRYWRTQLRLSLDQVHQAQQALHRCLMFPIADERPSCREERVALKKAQARQAHCEQKIERVRHWQRSVQHELFEYQGRISQLVRLIEIDVPQAIGLLHKIVRRLEEYQSIRTADPSAAYNDVKLAQDLWPIVQTAGEPASAAGSLSNDTRSVEDASPADSKNPSSKDLRAEAQRTQSQ
jgi:exonuclease VII large subunit